MTRFDGDTIVDDLLFCNRWEEMLTEVKPGDELELSRVRQIVCSRASTRDAERHGESWLESFLSYCERGGIGSLGARSDGTYVLVLANPLPPAAEAWEQVTRSWP